MSNQFQKQLDKIRQNRQVLLILIFLFVIVIFWTIIGLISSRQQLGISPELVEYAKPLIPTVDEETLQRIEGKREFSEDELKSFPIYKIISTRDGSNSRLVEISSGLDSLDPTPKPKATSVPDNNEESTSSADQNSED